MIEGLNYTGEVKRTLSSGAGREPSSSGRGPDACDAWQLLVRFFFAHRATLPTLAAELELSPAQCHVLHLIEPGRPIAMRELADTLSCDASNVTGLVDRL